MISNGMLLKPTITGQLKLIPLLPQDPVSETLSRADPGVAVLMALDQLNDPISLPQAMETLANLR